LYEKVQRGSEERELEKGRLQNDSYLGRVDFEPECKLDVEIEKEIGRRRGIGIGKYTKWRKECRFKHE